MAPLMHALAKSKAVQRLLEHSAMVVDTVAPWNMAKDGEVVSKVLQ